ncbi:uncharacterized protein LOC111713213 isoform X2 [Eurytemora carolleeae]|uniref:uncharacterized protein LOC111713213 isoform X2 n=1 Tax=Eurytemora carolleeae TaxID=1294199 RepID=UPI000C78BBB6|nr:uncharacterized protein LOC111713213 isoform X2 [Eurytemora carolleeae]|eukprot:XP_023343806.1 uncharacterized protein LOC111713213 isoform X2 [Eurytemora affinis]
MKPIPVPQLERVHEDLSIPSTCVHHKKETRFYFIGLDMFGCEICAEEIPSYAVSIHQFPPYNQRLLFDINGLITAWKTRKVQTLKSLENPLLEFQHTIRKKIRDLHREVDKLENKLIKQLQDELFHQQELKDRASQDQNEEILHLLKLQEMAKQSLVLQSDSASCNTYKLEKLISDLENKTPTFIEWMGVPHLDLDPEYLNRILEDNIQLSVNYPHISQDCAILPESEPEPVIQVINQPLTSVEITPAELLSVTHINSPSLFYIRKVSSQDLLYSLRVLLQRQGLQRVGAEEIKLDLEICSNLRRGRVTRINENSVHLYLLDSGETVEAAKGSLYHLPDLARQQPPLAYPCKLRFVEPLLSHVVEGGEKKWRIGAIQEFVTLTRNKKLVIPSYSSSDSILEIDLCYLPQPNTSLQEYVNLGDILVFRELAAHTHNKPDKKRNFPFPQPNYSHREEACVVVERVFSPQWFYVRSSGSAIKKRVDAIKQEIQKIDVRTLTLILAPAVNQPCIFIGESLFRGVISRVLREKKVEVTLIDVGTTAVCQLKAIRSIPHQLLSIQCLVRLVRLDDVFPVSGEDWNASANTAFKNVTLGKEFRMCLETPAEPDQPLTVSLYESYSDCDVSINSLMVYLNHARCKDRRHIQVKFTKPDSGTKNKQGFNMFNANILPWGPFPPRLPQPRPRPLKVFTPGTEIKCKVVSVVSPNRICVIPEEFISEEINLTTRIIEEVRREGVVLKELKVGIKCLARNSSMSFCRGVLLEVGEDRLVI